MRIVPSPAQFREGVGHPKLVGDPKLAWTTHPSQEGKPLTTRPISRPKPSSRPGVAPPNPPHHPSPHPAPPNPTTHPTDFLIRPPVRARRFPEPPTIIDKHGEKSLDTNLHRTCSEVRFGTCSEVRAVRSPGRAVRFGLVRHSGDVNGEW